MRDKFFFPAAIVLALAMVWLALSPAFGRMPTGPVAGDGVNYDQIRIDGKYLNKIYAGGDASLQLIKRSELPYQLYIETEAGVLRDEPEFGPHFRLASDLEVQFSGHKVRVTVRVRPTEERGAMQVALNYAAGRVGESGWQIFDLAPGMSDVSFEYDVPIAEADQGFDYLGIRPVVPSKSRAILVESVVIDRLGLWQSGPAAE